MLDNDFVKLALIVAGAIALFMVLNKFQLFPSEGYDSMAMGNFGPTGSMGSLPSTVPVSGMTQPVGLVQTNTQVMPTSAPPLAPVQSLQTVPAPDPRFQPQPVDDGAGMVMGAYTEPGKECYPKDQLTAEDLLPKDTNSKWAAVNPDGMGDLKDKNLMSAGYHYGINTQGNSLRNQSKDLRGDPAPNAIVAVSPWLQSTISPEAGRRIFEIGGCP